MSTELLLSYEEIRIHPCVQHALVCSPQLAFAQGRSVIRKSYHNLHQHIQSQPSFGIVYLNLPHSPSDCHPVGSADCSSGSMSSRLSSSSRLRSAHSPPQSSMTSCHKGFGKPRHCFNAIGRAQATARHSPRKLLRAVCLPTNHRKSNGEKVPFSTP